MRARFSGITIMVLLLMGITARAQDASSLPYQVELLYKVPLITSMVWAPDGRLFFTDKNGPVYVASAEGELQDTPLLTLEVRQENEDGVQSIALDPNFAENGYFYIYYTPVPEADGSMFNVVTRFTERDGTAVEPVDMLRFPNQSPLHQHHGGRLAFGPDGYLYLSVGDLSHWNVRSQNTDDIEGKIHRFAVVGDELQIPDDNPFPGSSVWAYGIRNAYSFIFDPLSGHLFATGNGPDCDDAVYEIDPGDNFGWGLIEMGGDDKTYCDNPERLAGAKPALIYYTPTIAPTGITVYQGEAFPDWQGDLLYCAFKPMQMYRVALDETRNEFVGDPTPVDTGSEMGCSIEVAVGPDGLIYYTNLIGMYRLSPVE